MKLSRLLSIVEFEIDASLSEHSQLQCIDSSMYRYTPTSERTFSALGHLKNNPRSTMKQDLLNCLVIHWHQSVTDTLLLKTFWEIWVGGCAPPRGGEGVCTWLGVWCPPPHISKFSAAYTVSPTNLDCTVCSTSCYACATGVKLNWVYITKMNKKKGR